MTWPDLISLGRVVLLVLERNEQRLLGRDVMLSKAVQPACFAGVTRDATVDDVRRHCRDGADRERPAESPSL